MNGRQQAAVTHLQMVGRDVHRGCGKNAPEIRGKKRFYTGVDRCFRTPVRVELGQNRKRPGRWWNTIPGLARHTWIGGGGLMLTILDRLPAGAAA